MHICITQPQLVNTLRPRQNGRHFPDDIFKWIFFNENVWISINISLKFVPRGPINNIPTLVQVMTWRLPGTKPLSEPMMVRLPTHICVTRPQWVREWSYISVSSHQSISPAFASKMFSFQMPSIRSVHIVKLGWSGEAFLWHVTWRRQGYWKTGHKCVCLQLPTNYSVMTLLGEVLISHI